MHVDPRLPASVAQRTIFVYPQIMSEQHDQHALAEGRAFPWHECNVPDVQKAIDFYTNALGMTAQSMSIGDMPEYHMLCVGGTPVCGVMSTSMMPPGVPPHWATYLGVDDVDACIEKVKAHGGTVVVEAMDVPTVGRMALIADNQGAHLWLFRSAS